MADPLQQRIDKFEGELNQGVANYCHFSYFARRLVVIGGVYSALFVPMLLLLKYFKGDDKSTELKTLGDYFDPALLGMALSWQAQCIIAVVILLIGFGWERKGAWAKIFCNGMILLATVPVFVYLAPDSATVLIRACHGLLLLVAALVMDRTFGFTKAWARNRFYRERLCALKARDYSGYPPNSREQDFDKLEEGCSVDAYRDVVGDTFFMFDKMLGKLKVE